MHHFLVLQHPAEFEECPAVAPEELASFHVCDSDLNGEADCDLADLTRGLELGCQSSIHENDGNLPEAGPVIKNHVLSSMPDLLSLAIPFEEAMSRATILEVPMGFFRSTFSSNNTCIGEP